MGNYYPLLVNLKRVKCLVIGGGPVAYRKTQSLLKAGADVTVISPRVLPSFLPLAEQGKIKFFERKYQSGDLKGFLLVYAALDDEKVSREIAREAEAEGVLLNMAHHPEQGNFIVPAYVERGELILSFSTGGKSPMLAARIRRDLEERYGSEYEKFLFLLGREREWALREIDEIEKRRAYFEALVYSDLPALIKAGTEDEVNREIDRIRNKLSLKRRES